MATRSGAAITACVALALVGCAASPRLRAVGGPAIPFSPDLVGQVYVGRIDAEGTIQVVDRYAQTHSDYDFTTRDPLLPRDTDPLRDLEFRETVEEAVRARLAHCARGARPLSARIYVDLLEFDSRPASGRPGERVDVMAGTVELIDPARSGAVVGRIAVRGERPAGGLIARIFSDRTEAAADEMAAQLCRLTFAPSDR